MFLADNLDVGRRKNRGPAIETSQSGLDAHVGEMVLADQLEKGWVRVRGPAGEFVRAVPTGSISVGAITTSRMGCSGGSE